MASSAHAALCAILAAAVWTLLGYALGRHVLPRVLAVGAAPILGWAVYNSLTLPLFGFIGFTPVAVTAVAALCLIASCVSLFVLPGRADSNTAPAIPAWAFAGAAILALVPAAAIAPKIGPDAVLLVDPIFDHSKVAIIDAMARLGLPPVNPFFGENGAPGRLAYYYLWYFSAAQLVLALGVNGWEADIGQTWFSAFSSLTLLMGAAVWLSKRSSAALWVQLLTMATTLRTTLATIFGAEGLAPYLAPSTGFAGWMFQAAWVPQHLTSASCVVLAMLLLAQYAARKTLALLALFVLAVTAGFESSTYVGGVTFALAASIAVPILLFRIEKTFRLRFLFGLSGAAVLAALLAAPFLLDQIATVGARGVGAPVIVHPYEVLGEAFPPLLRRILDVPAYWLILLPVEFPAIYFAGALALAVLSRRVAPEPEKYTVATLAAVTVAGLVISGLLISTLGDNNDLGWRSVLPAAMALIVAAAAGMTLRPRHAAIALTALGGLLLSLPDFARMVHYNFTGNATPAAKTFAQSPEMWRAVRRHAAPDDRVGNNPLYLQDMTPWPVNISWALLADRSSCFPGRELAIAYVPLTRARREAIHAQFVRVFEGKGTAADVSELATRYGCGIVVVTAEDGAWNDDPFALHANYALAETSEGRWRIYKLAPGVTPPGR